jgi:hypothetical protein
VCLTEARVHVTHARAHTHTHTHARARARFRYFLFTRLSSSNTTLAVTGLRDCCSCTHLTRSCASFTSQVRARVILVFGRSHVTRVHDGLARARVSPPHSHFAACFPVRDDHAMSLSLCEQNAERRIRWCTLLAWRDRRPTKSRRHTSSQIASRLYIMRTWAIRSTFTGKPAHTHTRAHTHARAFTTTTTVTTSQLVSVRFNANPFGRSLE